MYRPSGCAEGVRERRRCRRRHSRVGEGIGSNLSWSAGPFGCAQCVRDVGREAGTDIDTLALGGMPKQKDKPDKGSKVKASRREEVEVAALVRRIAAEAPERDAFDTSSVRFSDLPLSHYTMSGAWFAGGVCIMWPIRAWEGCIVRVLVQVWRSLGSQSLRRSSVRPSSTHWLGGT